MKTNLYKKYLSSSSEYNNKKSKVFINSNNKLKLTSLTKLNSENKDKCCIIS